MFFFKLSVFSLSKRGWAAAYPLLRVSSLLFDVLLAVLDVDSVLGDALELATLEVEDATVGILTIASDCADGSKGLHVCRLNAALLNHCLSLLHQSKNHWFVDAPILVCL